MTIPDGKPDGDKKPKEESTPKTKDPKDKIGDSKSQAQKFDRHRRRRSRKFKKEREDSDSDDD